MTYKEFSNQIYSLCLYYRGHFISEDHTGIWYGMLKDMDIERLKKVVNFYVLTHSESPKSPTDLIETNRLLELAECALDMPNIADLRHSNHLQKE